MQHQRLAVGTSVVAGLLPLSLFAADDLLNVTLVVTTSRTCEWCDRARSLRTCAGCRDAYYCSTKCQRRAWRGHKPQCAHSALR